MALKLSSTGKLLLTAGGRLKTCTCCGDPTRLYRRIFDCCARCRFVWVPSAYLDALGGEWNGTLLINGKCYGAPDVGELTREQIETTYPGTIIFEEDSITSSSTLNCADARAAEVCPACQECCITGYPGRRCFTGVQPADPERTSVCCNWGRQVTISWTVTRIIQSNEFLQPVEVSFDACTTRPGVGVVTSEDKVISGSCRIRRNGDGAACENDCTYTRLFSFCSGIGCVPGEANYYECGGPSGVFTSGSCQVGPILPGEVACDLPCEEYINFDVECASVAFQECPGKRVNSSYSCLRDCFGGIRQSLSEERNFHCIWLPLTPPGFCPDTFPGYCQCRELLQCKLSSTSTTFILAEWSVTIEDTEGCEVDPCTEYNGSSDCPPLLTPPADICSDIGGCPSDEPPALMAPPAPDSAWSFV